MKQIVICGAGFGGLNCALELSKSMPDAAITLIDQSPYHVLHGFMYEVATSDEELTSMQNLKQSIALPVAKIVAGTNITFKQATIKAIDANKKVVQLEHGSVPFDYVVLALGSEANYYGIPGAAEHSIPLKTLRDSFAIRNKIGFVVEAARMSAHHAKLRFIIAGGGFAGVELAAELKGLLDFLAWKNNYTREQLELLVVEGAPQLMPGLGDHISRDVYQRLDELGVKIQTSSLIVNVTETMVEFNSGEKLHYDALFWTAGVKAVTVPVNPGLSTDRGGRIETNQYFQAKANSSIFVIGDQACFIGTDGRPLPGTASQAIDHGKYVARVIQSMNNNQTPPTYVCRDFGYIVPLGGRWGISVSPHGYWKGFITYFARQIVWFQYLRRLIGFFPALRLIFFQDKIYSRNN